MRVAHHPRHVRNDVQKARLIAALAVLFYILLSMVMR